MTRGTLPRYNLAAVPVNDEVRVRFYEAARGFSSLAAGYLLGPGQAFPHATLCQFRAQDDATALRLVSAFVGRELTLRNGGLYIKPGEAEHAGKYAVGYMTRRSKDLMRLQSEAFDALQNAAVELLNGKGDAYFPHFTLARLSMLPEKLETSLFAPPLDGVDILCCLRLGLSDEGGQFLKTLDGPL